MTNMTEFPLKPGLGVDLVFNLDSESPSSKTSIIYDCNESLNQVIVAQPTQRVHLESRYPQMHISSLISKELTTKVRVGYPCRIIEALSEYRLSNQSKVDALLLEYSPTLVDINIRAAFRFHPNSNYDVVGKLSIGNDMYYSGKHFKFQDISLNGIGILIPKKIVNTRNPMLDLSNDTFGRIGILLKIAEERDSIVTTIESDVKVVRIAMNYNSMSGFAGCTLLNLSTNQEESLSRFIHNAQLYEIRMINRFK
jgi:hypothetical protein